MFIGPISVAVAALLTFAVDRFEPPMAVLIDDSGQTIDVPLSTLPPGARPGDLLASPAGPIIGDRAARAAALRARLARLAEVATDDIPLPPADAKPGVRRHGQ